MNEKEMLGKITFAKVRKIIVRTIIWLLVGILVIIILYVLAFAILSILAGSAGPM